ncbi:MAG: tetratricopeptide repeat protein [Candidatus Adiutrix sp.]|jgi:tetratricopeptide (TPR) repeat protein|nr:tetratricopeptide repeat protein [Candidatus Adiutrix sp.]
MTGKRGGPRLVPADLKRFGRKLRLDLEALVQPHDCRVAPLDEWPEAGEGPQDGGLVCPLKYKGRDLGRLVVFPAAGQPLAPELARLLPGAAEQALETLWLRKALATDRETGFFSRGYFLSRLPKILKGRPRAAARSLSLGHETEPILALVLAELGRVSEPGAALSAWAARLAERLAPRCPARLGPRRLAFLIEGRPEELRLALDEALAWPRAAAPEARPSVAWAAYPGDLGAEAASPNFRRQGRLLLNRASAALFQARQNRGGAVAFADLLARHGRIIQVLPLDRVVVGLGREAGTALGQVFLVNAPGAAGAEADFKGEVTLTEIAEGYALGRFTGAKVGRRVAAGDTLTFSRQDEAAGESRYYPAELAGVDDFLEALGAASSRPLALVLARLDGFEKNAAMLGREEAGRQAALVFEKILSAWPKAGLKSRWKADTLALAWPGLTQADLVRTAHDLAAELRASEPVSFGLLFSSGGLRAGRDLIADARKALDEAAFSGPGQVSVFGPLALNISGDRLFEGGDLSGALREYERGLALAPEHLNLLNSLGVCQGRLGRAREALATFHRIVGLDPENMMAHYNLGYTYLLAGRLPEAEESLARAAELAPDNFETLFHLGRVALELGHLDKALPALKKAGEVGGNRPAVFRLLGEALLLAHDHQGAMAAFKKAVKAAPDDAYALSALGTLFADLSGDLPVARSLFQRSVELEPTNSLYRQRIGRLLFTLGDFTGAEHHLKMAVEYGSQAPEVHFQLGRVAEETGRPDEAQSHFAAALAQDPAYKPALEKLEPDADGPET